MFFGCNSQAGFRRPIVFFNQFCICLVFSSFGQTTLIKNKNKNYKSSNKKIILSYMFKNAEQQANSYTATANS